MAQACRAPCRAIANNAGEEGSVVVQTLLSKKDLNIGFDASSHRYVNMIEAGIIDPVKVVRTALIDGAGVASLMATSEAMVVELPEKEGSGGGAGGGMGGGMGGMGGMGGGMGF